MMDVSTWQCGYTRRGAQESSAGWQSFALGGDGIPSDALNAYASMQSQNVASGIPEDNSGNPLRLFEIVADGQFLFLSRIQYGLLDEMGRRNNMFAHGIVFPLMDDKVVRDPNTFLTVGKQNFKKSDEEAQQIGGPLNLDPALDIERALNEVGIDRHRWAQLVYAYYAAREQKRPLYIKGVDDEHIRSVIYCMYMAIPFGMRKTISVANALVNPGNFREIIFSDTVRPGDFYFDLVTGQSNVLTEREEKKFHRWGFPDYAIDLPQPKINDYFKILEGTATSLGDPTGAKFRFLRIAHRIFIAEHQPIKDDEDLKYRIYEALQAGIQGNDLMDNYALSMLHQVNERDIELPDTTNELLTKYLKTTQSEELNKESRTYNVHVMMRQSIEEACDRLMSIPQEQFQSYAIELVKEQRGCEILDLYYAKCISRTQEWSTLDSLASEVSQFSQLPKASESLEAKAFDLYENDLRMLGAPVEALSNYGRFMEKIMHSSSMETVLSVARDIYWDGKNVGDFRFDMEEEYRSFIPASHPMSAAYLALLDTLRGVKAGNMRIVYDNISRFYGCMNDPVDMKERSRLAEELISYGQREGRALQPEEKDMIKLSVLSGWSDTSVEWSLLCDYIERNDWIGFEETYIQRTEMIPEECMPFIIMEKYNALLQEEVKNRRIENMMTLDMFLLMGKNMYDNPFTVLDDEKWAVDHILDGDSEYVVEGSCYLKEAEYQNLATNYIRNSDSCCPDDVKEWMSIRKKLDKQEKKGAGKPLAGLFRRK